MYRVNVGVVVVALLLVGCPDGADHGERPDPVADGGDDGGSVDGDQFVGCQTDEDCVAALGSLGTCQTASCDPVSRNCKPIPRANGAECDDGDLCTAIAQCKDGACQGEPKPCDDENPCTNDFCDPASGKCQAQPNSALCDDGNLCTQNDQCSNGSCTGTPNPTCQCGEDKDCLQFDDADLCNGVLECQNNQCVPKPGSEVTCPSDAANPCRVESCEPSTGECKSNAQPEGWPCNDSDACTLNDACTAGECGGEPMACDDDNPCTTNGCDKEQGCTFPPNNESCDDGDLCTLNDTCEGGQCVGTNNPDCGCVEDAECAQFEDGDLCNGTLHCNDGSCDVDPGTVVDCSGAAANAAECTVVACVSTSGECASEPALDGAGCTDGSACTSSDHCESGACVGTPIECKDENECTADGCDPATGCTHTALEGQTCDDENDCTDNDVCDVEGVCAGSGDCGCSTAADCAEFEDGDLCNGTLDCVGGECVVGAGTVVVCEPTGSCVEPVCVSGTGECVQDPLADGTPCDDGNACTEQTFCDGGTCEGSSVVCDDGNLCTDDACDTLVGCTHDHNDIECDDGNECTDNDKCQDGQCGGSPIVGCGCDVDADCEEFEDGDPCNGTLVCVSNKCVVAADSVVVCPPDDPTGCTTNACSQESGVCEASNAPDGKACDDGDACSLDDLCLGGECVSDTPLLCDDGNLCTDDSCEPGFGCVAAPNEVACDDGDPCTQGDVCADSLCTPGPDNVCGDSCEAAFTLSCGSIDTWATDSFGSTKVVEEYSCSTDTFPGGEYTYLFNAPQSGTVTVTLSNEDTITDIHVLEQTDAGCDPTACIATGYSSTSFQATEGTTYYLVVDGYLDAEGGYTINVDCAPASEAVCDDGEDDDLDGLTDCADDDCALDAACLPAQCEPAWTLTCGSQDSWGNYLFGATDVLDGYTGCGNPWPYWGPEYTYTFESPVDGDVTVAMTNLTADTDVLVLAAGLGGTCQADACIAWGESSVTFTASAGVTYYIVVDGAFFAEGTHTIELTCPDPTPVDTESNCTDGFDDDQDGLVDCQDGDCFGSDPSCQPACVPDTVTLASLECPSDTDSWDTAGSGGGAKVSAYGCPGNDKEYAAPEYAYTYVAETDGTVTVSLSNEESDTDLILLRDQGLGCNPASCEAWHFSSVTFDAVAGQTYYIVVDGSLASGGEYDLTFTCGQ